MGVLEEVLAQKKMELAQPRSALEEFLARKKAELASADPGEMTPPATDKPAPIVTKPFGPGPRPGPIPPMTGPVGNIMDQLHEARLNNFASEIARQLGPRMGLGQTSGGLIGGVAGGLLAGPGGAIGGASLLGAAGDAAEQKLRYGSVNPRETLAAGAAEGLGEIGGRLLNAVSSPIVKRLIGKDALKTFAERIFSTPVSPTDAGKELRALIGRNVGGKQGELHQQLESYFAPAFARIRQSTQGGGVRTDSLRQIAQQALDENTRSVTQAKVPIYGESEIKTLEGIAGMNPVVDFETMWNLSKKWNKEIANKELKGLDRIHGQLAKTARNTLKDPQYYENINPAVAQDVKQTFSDYARVNELTDLAWFRRMTKQLRPNPEIATDIIGDPTSKHGVKLQQIRDLKESLLRLPDGSPVRGGQNAWDNLRTAWHQAQINKYIGPAGVFDTAGYEKMLNNIDKDALRELYTHDELDRINRLNKLLQSKNVHLYNPALGGGLFPAGFLAYDIYRNLTEEGGVDWVGLGRDGGIILSASIIAAAARSRILNERVASVLRYPKLSKEAIPAVTRLVRYLSAEAARRIDRPATEEPEPGMLTTSGVGPRGF